MKTKTTIFLNSKKNFHKLNKLIQSTACIRGDHYTCYGICWSSLWKIFSDPNWRKQNKTHGMKILNDIYTPRAQKGECTMHFGDKQNKKFCFECYLI